MLKVLLQELQNTIPGSLERLVCRASFESRSTSVAKALAASHPTHAVVLASKIRSSFASKHTKELNLLLAQTRPHLLDHERPDLTAELLRNIARESCSPGGKTLIDITTFRREELLILLRMLVESFRPDTDCDLAYVEAADMSTEWLSRGTVGFRSVLGYSGNIAPSRSLHLVVMLGFEVQRARDIIDNYEPSQLTVGYGRSDASIRPAFHERNLTFFKALKSWYGREFSEFQFSLLDPLDAKAELADAIGTSNRNVVIAPMNNKLSTIGAGLLAIENDTLQICYSLVSEYNQAEYSTPGTHVYLISLREMMPTLDSR